MILPIGMIPRSRDERDDEGDDTETRLPAKFKTRSPKTSLKPARVSAKHRRVASSGTGSPIDHAGHDDEHGQFTYDVSHGYPKGIPEGVKLRVNINGRESIIHGVPYEELNKKLQEELDDEPLDDAGQIRVFVKDEYDGSYIEFGSNEHAMKFKKMLDDNGRRLL